MVALEREVSPKAVGCDAAVAKKKKCAVRHGKQIQMHVQYVPAIGDRVEAMENTPSSKADIVDASRLSLAIADHQARHEAAHVRLLEHRQEVCADFGVAQFYNKKEVGTRLKQLWWHFKNSYEVTLTLDTLPNGESLTK